jgi:hypothetical protein
VVPSRLRDTEGRGKTRSKDDNNSPTYIHLDLIITKQTLRETEFFRNLLGIQLNHLTIEVLLSRDGGELDSVRTGVDGFATMLVQSPSWL